MNSLLRKLGKAVQVLLLAPITLPSKVMQVVKYVALALGVIEALVDVEKNDDETVKGTEETGE